MNTFLWVFSEARRVNKLSYHHVNYWLNIYAINSQALIDAELEEQQRQLIEA